MTLQCAVCLHADPHDRVRTSAVTVIEGYAVCEDHVAFVAHGERWAAIQRHDQAEG
jgi:hypothetical protein